MCLKLVYYCWSLMLIVSKTEKNRDLYIWIEYNYEIQWIVCLYTGYCQKLSNRKKILEERFLKLTTEGILSWYKGEEDSDPRGSIQIRGESISSDSDDPNTVFVNTKNRRFHFQFISQTEAKKWSSVMEWHSQRSKPEHSTMVVRNWSKLNWFLTHFKYFV